MNLVCPKCQSWNLGTPSTADKFCSWCGSLLFDLEVRLAAETVYFFPENGGKKSNKPKNDNPVEGELPKRKPRSRPEPGFKIVLQNNGSLPIQIMGLAAVPVPCVYLAPARSAAKKMAVESKPRRASAAGGIQLAPGETREVQGRFHLPKLRQAMRARTAGQAAPGWREKGAQTEAHWQSLKLQVLLRLSPACSVPAGELTVLPPPEFELMTPTLHLQPVQERQAGAATTPCAPAASLRLRSGTAKISRVESAHPGIRFNSISPNGQPLALHASEENSVAHFQVEVSNELLAAYRQKQRPLLSGVKIICAEPPGVFRPQPLPLQIIPSVLAHLSFPDITRDAVSGQHELKTWALAGRLRTFPGRV